MNPRAAGESGGSQQLGERLRPALGVGDHQLDLRGAGRVDLLDLRGVGHTVDARVVGAFRPEATWLGDRPSSAAAFNLQCAAQSAAFGDIAEVMVCMFGPTSDRYNLLHRGTRVRKMHSSYRSTFRTLGDIPLATVEPTDPPKPIRTDYNKRNADRKLKLYDTFEERVAMLYYYPNMHPDIVDSMVDNGYKGILIAGTGLGHVNKPLYPALKRAVDSGVAVYMTVQTLWGYAQMYVYDTGRDLMELGVVPLGNMLPEVGYIKLGWALGMSSDLDEVKRLMLDPIAGEITPREQYNAYVVLQGGMPEVDEFLHNNWR